MSTPQDTYDDALFDVAFVEQGGWVPGPYGENDQRGSFNEVTPSKTARALALLDTSRPVQTYNLSETLYNGFPAIGTRVYEQTLYVTGYVPAPDFGGICTSVEPAGPGRISTHEERVSLTYNIGTKVNGLHHCGVGAMFYNGYRGPDIAATWGTLKLGSETAGPIVTRGVLIDVVGQKVSNGDTSSYFLASNGQPVLASGYRITVEDIEIAISRAELSEPIGPGDVVLLRTGWRELIECDPDRWLNDLRLDRSFVNAATSPQGVPQSSGLMHGDSVYATPR